TVPMQDVKAAIDELEHAVTRLGLKGAELDTNVNGEQWDEPKFLPFFKAAEQMGAVLFYHPQPQHNFLMQRTNRDGLFNSLGVILDDAIVGDRKSTRLNSSHGYISYAVFCLKKKKKNYIIYSILKKKKKNKKIY